jgi:tRNA-dihydrouridine synthase B
MKLALAPMATLTHEGLRLLIHRYGDPDEYFSEMINAPSFLAGGMFEPWYVRTAPCPDKMVWQLTGSAATPMIRVARSLARLGGIGVDLNMGCSAPDIAHFGGGVAWMSKPLDEVAFLVRGVREQIDAAVRDGPAGNAENGDSAPSAVPVASRLSVKLRLGVDEDYPRLLEFCRMLVGEGVELITLHPRVRKDKYGRPARPRYVGQLASDLTIPVYGNGDVDSAEGVLSYMTAYPCSGLMLGRTAVRKPWIFSDIRRLESDGLATGDWSTGTQPSFVPPTREPVDHLEVARFFLDSLAMCQPPEFWISRAHRFFFFYCDNFSFAHHIRMKIQNAASVSEILPLLEAYFGEVPGDRYLS